jgi:OOP family OmpA-OmpF porin
MNKAIKTAVVLIAMIATPSFAQLYSGASAGRVDHKQSRSNWTPAGGSAAFEDTDAGFKLFGGYKFTENFGVEGGYDYLGQYTATPVSGASIGKAVIKTNSWNLFGVGTLPLPKDFSVFAKLGVSSNYSKMNFSSNGGLFNANDAGTNRKTSFAFGIGAGYNVMKNLTVRVEYEDFGKAGESNNNFTLATKTSDSKPKLLSIGLVHSY